MSINPIIPNNFKKYSDKNPDFPKEMLELLWDLLTTAERKALEKDALEKLFDAIVEKYASNDKILKWSEKYNE